MAGVTYKCQSCGAYLAFDPESQMWKCPFCDSTFAETELSETDTASAQQAMPVEGEGGQVMYRCPSCGSEIVTDETTVATQCYYCHSPVVLEGKMTDDLRPDTVLPFAISKEQAVETFLKWVKNKQYVPKAFFSPAQVESMTGVYYPHFVTDCELDGAVDGEGCEISTHSDSRYITTHTRHYHVRREGRMTFRNILRPALSKANRKLSEGIHPFPLEDEKPFSEAYLSGFVAERRDVEAAAVQVEVRQEVSGYVEPLLSDSLHYDRCNVTPSSRVRSINSRYVLLPTWILTYPNKNDPQDPYYYALNGCTGEVCGKLPVDKSKLRRKALMVFGVVFVIACLASYFLF